jgi:hypothetical protein
MNLETIAGRRNVTPEQAVEMAFLPSPEGWAAKTAPQSEGEPRKRTVRDWIALLPHMRFAFTKHQLEDS